MWRSGKTRISAVSVALWSQRASFSGPVDLEATAGRVWRPRRRAVMVSGSMREVRRDRLAGDDRAAGRGRGGDLERGRDAAAHDLGRLSGDFGAPARRPRIDHDGRDERQRQERHDLDRDQQRAEGQDGQGDDGAGCRAQRKNPLVREWGCQPRGAVAAARRRAAEGCGRKLVVGATSPAAPAARVRSESVLSGHFATSPRGVAGRGRKAAVRKFSDLTSRPAALRSDARCDLPTSPLVIGAPGRPRGRRGWRPWAWRARVRPPG